MNTADGHRSTAALAGHPLHPMMTAFPIAFLSTLVLSDLVGYLSGEEFWLRLSFLLCVAGFLTGAASAVLGAIDFFTIAAARSYPVGWIHFLGNGAVMVISFLNAWLRWNGSPTVPWPWGLPLSVGAFLLLGVTGWCGGELSYRYRIGVMPREHLE